uniref:Basic leucine zipper domain-containing protein n=1 Tax=Panagrolaimus sp. JU765 TaxID=591449 RepID=A0AC34RD76_9BILA
MNIRENELNFSQLSPLKDDLQQHGFCSSPTESVSSISSSSSSITTQSTKNCSLPELSDEELAQLSVRQLNLKLQGHDRQIVSALKQKRRTLKNRGYALNCRVRRIQNQIQLEADNVMLREQVRYLTETLHQLQNRLNYYEPNQNHQISLLHNHNNPNNVQNYENRINY